VSAFQLVGLAHEGRERIKRRLRKNPGPPGKIQKDLRWSGISFEKVEIVKGGSGNQGQGDRKRRKRVGTKVAGGSPRKFGGGPRNLEKRKG